MPASRNSRAGSLPLSKLVEATQAELAATGQALRSHAYRLGGLRRQLRARLPARRLAHAVETNQHTQVTALTASLDSHLADTLIPAIADLEASAKATGAEPFPRPEAHEKLLVELLGRRDSLVNALTAREVESRQAARLIRAHLPPIERKGAPMSTPVALKLKSERIQLPGAWEFSPDQTSASARFEFGSRRGAVAFVGLASELAERESLKVGFLLTDGSAVRVTIEAETDGTFSERDLELAAALNRLVGEEASP